jgi:hypothetical protein
MMFIRFATVALLGMLTSVAHAQNCPALGYTLSGSSIIGTRQSFGYKGGVTRVQIAPPPGCTWQIANVPSWVTILGPMSGATTSIVVIGVETNTSTTARDAVGAASMTIGGVRFGLAQAAAPPGCTFSLQTPSQNVPANGQTGSNSVNSTGAACEWYSFSNRNWLQLYPIEGQGTTSFSYTVFPNFSTGTRTATGSVGGQDFSVVQSAAAGAYNERLVRLLYFNFLGRLPAPSEVAFHVQNLTNGMTPVDLVVNFLDTLEFRLGGRFLAGVYVGLLVRDAEFNGWLFQRNDLSSSGNPPAYYTANFLNGSEYMSKFGTTTNAQFVELLYQYILQRTPSATESQDQVNALNGGLSRANLATGFLNSEEFRNGRDPRLMAFLLYATLLSRDPSVVEFSVRQQQIENAANKNAVVRTIIQEIMNSAEFVASLT